MLVHRVAGQIREFHLTILVQAVAVEGPFSYHFERLQYLDHDGRGADNRALLNAWDQSFPPVFVSYAHNDKAAVGTVVKNLKKHSIRVLGDWDLNVGELLIPRISEFIATAGCVLAILTPAAVASRWVNHELEQAMREELDGHRKRVLPILLIDCELPGFLRGRLFADLRSGDPGEFARMLHAIRTLGMW
jgi:hypothetical protein